MPRGFEADAVRLRTKSCALVIRSMMNIGSEHNGQRGWQLVAGRGGGAMTSRSVRHRSKDAARLRLANSPEWRMRTTPFGRTWIRNRRRNSSVETVSHGATPSPHITQHFDPLQIALAHRAIAPLLRD